jgi:transposase-like protein
MKRKKTETKARTKHSAETKETARKMYLRGLYLTEISVLCGVPLRTLEKWQTCEKWTLIKDTPEIKRRAFELSKGGRTYKQIAELLKINPVTVWRYIKAVENETAKI